MADRRSPTVSESPTSGTDHGEVSVGDNHIRVVDDAHRRAAIILLVDAGVVTSEEVEAAERYLDTETDHE